MRTRTKGFSLVELLLVIAVLGILLSIGAITLNKVIKTQKLQEATVTLAENLRQAGNHARLESRTVRVKVSSSSISWDYGTDASQFKSDKIPYSASISPAATITFSGRGLPLASSSFTVGLYSKSKQVFLLPTGAVISR